MDDERRRDWISARTAGAPGALRDRAHQYLESVGAELGGTALALAGQRALQDAARAGVGRGAALDLLAADALITLALLDVASHDPAALESVAMTLRRDAAGIP